MLPLLGALVTIGACAATDSVGNIPSNPAVEVYASATGVVIANMTKVSDNLYTQDLTVGTGKTVASGDSVSIRYTGWLIDGTVFDTNVGGTVLTYPVGSGYVIQGWEMGIPGMKVGGKRKLVIGSTLGYANSGRGSIPPNATLVFDVTVLSAK